MRLTGRQLRTVTGIPPQRTAAGESINTGWRWVLLAVILALATLEYLGERNPDRAAVAVPAADLEDHAASPWQQALVAQGHLLNLEIGPVADWTAAETAPSVCSERQ